MSPSRGLFARYSYDNLWDREVRLSLDWIGMPKSLFIASFAFDVLTLAALICGVVWACLIRNYRGALKGVLTSLFAWLIAMVLLIIEESLVIAGAIVTQYYVIDLFLYDFFLLLSECMLIFVFYNIIHKLLQCLTDTGRPYAAVVILHWIILALAVALSVASWVLYVVYDSMLVQGSLAYHLGMDYSKVESARVIFFWVISLEILAWSIFVTVKAGSHRFVSRMPAVALIIGSVFWFALNIMWAIVYIRYVIPDFVYSPKYLSTVESVCQFFFCVGIYVGILLCCMNWSKVGPDDKPAQTTQYGPVSTEYPTYPADQTYPHYPQYPEQHPPHMQQAQDQQTHRQYEQQ